MFVMYIGIVFKFCQTHGSLPHWTPQIPWQYFGREFCTTTLFLITKYWGYKKYCAPLVQKLRSPTGGAKSFLREAQIF